MKKIKKDYKKESKVQIESIKYYNENDPCAEGFWKRVSIVMDIYGYTKYDLATSLEISYDKVTRMFRENIYPELPLAYKISQIFYKSFEFFYNGIDATNQSMGAYLNKVVEKSGNTVKVVSVLTMDKNGIDGYVPRPDVNFIIPRQALDNPESQSLVSFELVDDTAKGFGYSKGDFPIAQYKSITMSGKLHIVNLHGSKFETQGLAVRRITIEGDNIIIEEHDGKNLKRTIVDINSLVIEVMGVLVGVYKKGRTISEMI